MATRPQQQFGNQGQNQQEQDEDVMSTQQGINGGRFNVPAGYIAIPLTEFQSVRSALNRLRQFGPTIERKLAQVRATTGTLDSNLSVIENGIADYQHKVEDCIQTVDGWAQNRGSF